MLNPPEVMVLPERADAKTSDRDVSIRLMQPGRLKTSLYAAYIIE